MQIPKSASNSILLTDCISYFLKNMEQYFVLNCCHSCAHYIVYGVMLTAQCQYDTHITYSTVSVWYTYHWQHSVSMIHISLTAQCQYDTHITDTRYIWLISCPSTIYVPNLSRPHNLLYTTALNEMQCNCITIQDDLENVNTCMGFS
jgi:hypothetical protein